MALVDLNCRLKMVNLLSVVESKHGIYWFWFCGKAAYRKRSSHSSTLNEVRAQVSCVATSQADDMRKAEVRNETCVEQAPYPHNQGAISVAWLP
jgi:hypothetical protein